ncbi:2-isopropylmalate synthase [Pirellulimonas nuda]|uniref:2-isopropylmalate synthase n=1 Tax=Pirellulimonas nuda TaxID=2528009 RepID=A0A518D7Y1_9BACT|nr:2-isopropylmalate synthase [Pirellulimonas nuda]QDU87560.1 2-isopropylmalate synthase [Pirellulimonas nuda]
MRRITIFDTTLRDGEQSPGASMDLNEKLEVAQALVDLGVDVIEAGFPIASPGDFEAVRAIAGVVRGVQICGLARCNDKDIDRAWEALTGAERPRIHVFLATSAIHREFKLKMGKEEIIARAAAGVRRAKKYCDNIEFSPEDAARTEPDFLCQVVEAAIAAGATTVNIPDTVGYATPAHMGGVIQTLVDRVPNLDRAVVSVHCHNDLGLAVANSLAAVEHGAGQVECTINGIGERAGNCALEEIVMALRTRGDFYNCDTGIETTRLAPTSRLVSGITGMQVQRNKAIVGRNAFAHEAGIHQDGMLKQRSTYEIMRPEDVGVSKTDLVLGKHSGRAALADRAKALGYHVSSEELDRVFDDFKKLADRKKEIFDADIAALIDKRIGSEDDAWSLVSYEVRAASGQTPSSTVTLSRADESVSDTFFGGDGPLDALFNAIEKITGTSIVVRDFRVRSVTRGKDAQGETTIEAEHGGKLYRGRGVSTDTVEASVLAFLAAVNRVAVGSGQPLDGERPGAI